MMETSRLGSVAVASALLALGCGERNTYAPPPSPQVVVTNPAPREVTTYGDYTGHTSAIEAVEIRARVQGVLKSMHFQPATDVKQGDLLFVIEPDLYEARVQRAEADVANARAQVEAAEAQLAITEAIFQRKAGSKADLVQRTQTRNQAIAGLKQTEANLAAAKLDLTYTRVYAPIGGRIDRNLVDVGNLVGAGEATVLANIVRQDPMYAYFDVSENDVLQYRELARKGETATAGEERRVEAFMQLGNESGFVHVGRIDYLSNRVNPSTGTFEVRAVFSNADGRILPGLFVRVRVPFTRGTQLVVPEEAVGTDQGGHFLFVVDSANTVKHRQVRTGTLVDGMRIILEGVTADDVVIVNGLQRVRPGVVVSPIRAEAAAANGAPGAQAPAEGAKPAAP